MNRSLGFILTDLTIMAACSNLLPFLDLLPSLRILHVLDIPVECNKDGKWMVSQTLISKLTLQDEKTGEAIKVRGTSWVHSVKETVDAAEVAGFTIIGDVKERGVTQGMIDEGIVGERAKKWIGVNMWCGMILRKTS